MRRAPSVRLTASERRQIAVRLRAPETPPRTALRLRVALRAADGAQNRSIAKELGASPATVALWRRRLLTQGIPGLLHDAPRPGRPATIPTSAIETIVWRKLGGLDPSSPRWSARRLAASLGVSKSTVQRVWEAHQGRLRRAAAPPRRDAATGFVEKVTDFVGLYLDPPHRAMVFAVDERAHASSLPPLERRALSELRRRGRDVEFRAFLQTVDRETPSDLDLHLLLDNRMAPSPPEISRWLARHPRFHFHFLPSDGSGPNLIDRWFDEFTRRRRAPSAFPSVARLRRAIHGHFAAGSSSGGPFVWAATSDEIRDRGAKAPNHR